MTDYRQQRRVLVAHDLYMLSDVLKDLGQDSISIEDIAAIADEIKAGEPIYASIHKVTRKSESA